MKFGGSVHAQGAYVRTRTRSSFISREKESNVGWEESSRCARLEESLNAKSVTIGYTPGHDRIKRLVAEIRATTRYVAGAEDPCQNIKPFLLRSNFE